MISKELYNLAIEADKVSENNGGCGTCFCGLIKENIQNSISLNKSFVNWKNKNSIYTICSSVLFYLEDLGIIKIISGAPARNNGVVCKNLKYTINKNFFQGNKI
ncbi:MAG: hypothetical protein SPI94_02590 [Candidatus Onthovivens sp.]|nr:hypothetical protein [Candidatus Onthovivens sp.]